MKVFLRSVVRKSAYVIAVVIILAAILVSVSRIVTPALDQHRTDFEKWASALLQKPVTIKTIRVDWYQYQPEISLNQVTVLDEKTKNPILQIDKVSVFISIPQSLWQHKFVPSGLMISGSDVNVHENAAGEISVQGFPALGGFNSQPYGNESRFVDILGWLSLQPRLVLRDIDVRYTGFTGEKRFVTLYNLSLANTSSEHSILGKAVLHQELPTEITLAFQWQGESVDLSKITAKVYLYVSGLSLSQWMKGFVWHGWQLNQGVTSAKLWAEWDHGSWQKIQSNFQTYGLSLYSQTDKSIHKISRVSGNVGWKREGNSQVFAGDDLLLDLPAHLWPVSNFYVLLSPDANGVLTPKSANIGYVDLHDIETFLASDPIASTQYQTQSLHEILTDINLKGNLQNTAITFPTLWTDWKQIAFNTNFNQISFTPWKQFPGMTNLSGAIKWNVTDGDLTFKSMQSKLQYDSYFTHPLNLEQLSGNLLLQQEKNNDWTWRIPSLQILNHDVAVNLNGTMTFASNASPVADLNANFTLPQANRITQYLPARILDPDLVEWLQKAFVSGEIKSGHAELRGKLSDFPFDQGNGLFKVSTTVSNIDLHYAPNWPNMRRANGSLIFSGRQMTVDLANAQILDIPLVNVHAIIPYFGDAQPQILNVDSGEIRADFAQALNFVHASPLEKSIGKMFAGVALTGPINLKLALTVPLKHPDETKVQGNIAINDGEMNMPPWKLDLTHINGQINFTENTTDANNITAQIFNKPLQLSLATIEKTKDLSIVQAKVATNFAIPDLENWLNLSFSQYAQGATDVTGTIDFSLQQAMHINLHANLAGLALNLPDQYGKKADETRDFSTDITIQDQQPLRIKLNYGKLLGSTLLLEKKDEKFKLIGANLHLGTGEATWPPTSGIYITGNVDKLDWSRIKNYLNQSGANTNMSSMLHKVDISANSLDIFGQSIKQVHLQLTPTKNNWNISITSPDVTGQIAVPSNFTRQGLITAQFQKMNLQALSGAAASPTVEIKSLPAISLMINDFNYNHLPFGQVQIKTIPSNNGLSIQTLRIDSPRLTLQASGDWIKTSNGSMTHLKGNALSSHVSDLLNSFGFDVHNFISSNGRLDFNLNWQDAPYAPALGSIDGTASLSMGAGRIVDVGQGSSAKMGIGQLLSIFSLQTIPRRLTLDFSDVFMKGYSFDSVKGDFSLSEGDATTSNFYFDGPVAKVGINGVIGLKDKDYDFILIVTPYVTSSIPVAATIVTVAGIANPLIGLGAIGANLVLGSQVSKATTYYYEVTGPWNNPVWKSVKVFKGK